MGSTYRANLTRLERVLWGLAAGRRADRRDGRGASVSGGRGWRSAAVRRSDVGSGVLAHCFQPDYHWLFPFFLLRIIDPMRHVLSAVVQNVPGVLAHISGMLASRGYNIDSLAVGETEDPQLSRMTFVVVGDDRVLEQIRKQLEKIVTVVKVVDVSSQDYVERDLMLLKVKAPPGGKRSEIRELTDIFRGRIVVVCPGEVMIEISGRENNVESFI